MNAAPLIIFAVVAVPMLAFLGWVLWRRWSVVVGSRQAGLVIRRGRATATTLPTGIHFAAPWNQTVEIYPDYEMTYMTVPPDRLTAEGTADADFADPPFGVIDGDRASGEICYTLRFTVIRGELKQIHERFGPQGIKGIIRDESRRTIQTAFAEENYRLADLVSPSRAALESALSERIKERLAVNGFSLVFFSLQEPDLRELGQSLREQVTAREELALEQLRIQIDEVKAQRMRAQAQIEVQLEAERVRARSATEADATLVRARAEVVAEEERELRRAATAGKVREVAIAKRLELVAMEADLRLKRAEALAQSNRALADGLSELLVRLESIESWREVMERWDGRMTPPALSPGTPSPLPVPEPLPRAAGPAGEADSGGERHPAPPMSWEVDEHGA
jgi:regulator of protease activity HflC (stomatin/prohibitin superfamily)